MHPKEMVALKSRPILIVALVIGLLAITPPASIADPASDLATAQERESLASAEADEADQAVDQAKKALIPIDHQAARADRADQQALANVEEVKNHLVAERTAAAHRIEATEADFRRKKSTHDQVSGVGIGLVAMALLLTLAAVVLRKAVHWWPLSKRITQLVGGALIILLLAGLSLAFLPASPKAPAFSAHVLKLADYAKGDPADPPSSEFLAAEASERPLAAKAKPLDDARSAAETRLADAEAMATTAHEKLASTKRDVGDAARSLRREEAHAEAEARFKEEATTIDYKQLYKNADAYKGDKVVYRGQIFQIQESEGQTIILLSVTDEGYGFWTDEIWVEYEGSIAATEESIITVYGTITGTEEYETQIGGSRYLPSMQARYIEE